MAKTIEMTSGSSLKLIVKFAIPLFLGNIFQQLYNMADSCIVGQKLGVDALTAVGASSSVTFLIFGFCIGICAGFGIPVAQRFGARDFDGVRRLTLSSFYLSGVMAAVMTVLTCVFTRQILELLNTPEKLMDDASSYLFIIFLGLPFTVIYNECAAIARALGDSKTPFFYLVLSALLNVGLDILFIFGFGSGVCGAAIATIISQGISGVLCMVSLLTKYPVLHGEKSVGRISLRPDMKSCLTLIRIGLPMGLQSSITAIGSILLQTAVNGLDIVYVSAYTIAIKLKQLFIPEFDSVGTAMATYVGQNYGAGRNDRIRKGIRSSMLVSAVFYVVTVAVNVLFGKYLIGIFIRSSDPGNAGVIEAAYRYILIDVSLVFVLALLFIFRYSIQGMGRSAIAVVAGVCEMIARLVMSILVIPSLGWSAACCTDPLAWGLALMYCLPLFIYILCKSSAQKL